MRCPLACCSEGALYCTMWYITVHAQHLFVSVSQCMCCPGQGDKSTRRSACADLCMALLLGAGRFQGCKQDTYPEIAFYRLVQGCTVWSGRQPGMRGRQLRSRNVRVCGPLLQLHGRSGQDLQHHLDPDPAGVVMTQHAWHDCKMMMRLKMRKRGEE